MRLTNTLRDSVKYFLLEKAFPSAEEKAKLLKISNLIVRDYEAYKIAKEIYDDHAEYVSSSKSITISFPGDSFYVDVPYNYARYRWNQLVINVPGIEKKYPELYEACQDFQFFRNRKSEYRNKVHHFLLGCKNASEVEKAIPETKEFFDRIRQQQKEEKARRQIVTLDAIEIRKYLKRGEEK